MLVKQTSYISPSPVTATIGGTFQLPIPPTFIVPAYNIQDGNEIVTTGRGIWVNSFDYYGRSASGATTYLIPDIEGSYSDFCGAVATSITSLNAPNLVYVGGGIIGGTSATLASLTSISLPKLFYLGSIFSNITANSLTTLDLSSLVVLASMLPSALNGLTSLNLPKVKTISQLGFASTGCTSISTPSLVSILITSLAVPACTTWTLPTLGTWKICTGNISISSCAFNQATVDNLLSALAYMDGTNNTSAYSTGRTVLITGTSSAPTNLGSTTTAGSNFVGTGTTCTVNLTGHGYATGDVLRVSGITTLTLANRYAVITVVNANQFTYTMAGTQNLTGAGTATVIKAGASAKALVTRGVTLTTN